MRCGRAIAGIGIVAAAVGVVVPPIGNLLTARMLTHMLVQIPLLFACGVVLGLRVQMGPRSHWRTWNLQGASGLLFSAFVLAYWMTPIALDHAAADGLWNIAKIVSVVVGGFTAGLSWRLGSVITRVFYIGNMVWMTITAGLLYQQSDQRLCNAYLWDDQVRTGQALVVLSLLAVCLCVYLLVPGRRAIALPD